LKLVILLGILINYRTGNRFAVSV